jgi:hypothetical protein
MKDHCYMLNQYVNTKVSLIFMHDRWKWGQGKPVRWYLLPAGVNIQWWICLQNIIYLPWWVIDRHKNFTANIDRNRYWKFDGNKLILDNLTETDLMLKTMHKNAWTLRVLQGLSKKNFFLDPLLMILIV